MTKRLIEEWLPIFEALRLGCATFANDINPVAVLVQKATYEWPAKYGTAVLESTSGLPMSS
jgi:adenine-specific DNA methylase